MGRPKIEIDPAEVEKLAGLNCSNQEIADFLGVGVRTIETRFCAAIKKGRSNVKTSLKRKQYDVALGGNTTMLIWLGKQYLGQSDKMETTVKQEDLDAVIERELERLATAEQASPTQPLTGEK